MASQKQILISAILLLSCYVQSGLSFECYYCPDGCEEYDTLSVNCDEITTTTTEDSTTEESTTEESTTEKSTTEESTTEESTTEESTTEESTTEESTTEESTTEESTTVSTTDPKQVVEDFVPLVIRYQRSKRATDDWKCYLEQASGDNWIRGCTKDANYCGNKTECGVCTDELCNGASQIASSLFLGAAILMVIRHFY